MKKIERYVSDLMTVSGVEKEGKEQNVGLALYHLLMSAALRDLMSDDDKELFRQLTKKLQYFFCTRLSLKERKRKTEKKIIPPNPLLKEKEKKEKAEKHLSIVADAKEAFRKECLQYVGQYGEQRVADFYRHWTEDDANGRMRFERERFWNTATRLERWMKNEYSVANEMAAQRLQKLKKQQSKEVSAQERNEANDRLWQQYADMKKGAVSHEEWLRMKEKETKT